MSQNARKRPETPDGPWKVKHGIVTWLKSGQVNPSIRGFRRIQRYLREIKRDLVADLGGPERLTAAQEILVEGTIQAYGVLLLAGAYTSKHSILRPDAIARGIIELQPVLGKQYIAFLNVIRMNLVVLGLDRKKGDDLTPEALRGLIEGEAKDASCRIGGKET